MGAIALAAALACAAFHCAAQNAAQANMQGLQHLGGGRFAEAEASFRQAVKAEERNAIYNQNLAVALTELGRFDEAIPIYRAALDMRGTHAIIHRNLGDALFVKERVREAMEQFEKALAINPAEPVHTILMDSAFILGESEKWVSTFERQIKETRPDARAGIDTVFMSEQGILHSLHLHGRYDEVIARAGKGLEAIKGVPAETGGYVIPIITPFFFFIRSVPKDTINVAPIISNLHTKRGAAYLRKGMLDEAISELKLALGTQQDLFAGMLLGVAMIEKGDLKEALYQLRRFIERRPTAKTAWLYYAVALKLSGESQAAEEQLKRYKRLLSEYLSTNLKSHFDVVEALAWNDLVWERREDAFKRYSQVVTWCPTCGRSHRALAELYLHAGDKARAEEYAGKALALMPNDPATKKLAETLGVGATTPAAAVVAPAGKSD